MALLLPVQTFFSQQFGAIRKYTLKYTDQRIKTVNEILVGCEVMKLYNWYRNSSCSCPVTTTSLCFVFRCVRAFIYALNDAP